ncbi:MAG: PP2C family protein-serine/threonine phosphatase [Calditrichota bacterium]
MLNGFWIAGLTFLSAAVIGWILEELKLGYFVFNNEDEWVFSEGLTAFSMLDEWLPNAAIITLTALVFAPLYLRNQLKDSSVLRIVLTIMFAILGQHLFQYEPRWIALLVLLPVAYYWSSVVYKYDMVTLFTTLLILGYLLGVAAIRFVPDGYLNVVFITGGVVSILLFMAGIFFAMSPRRISDYENYVPPYVSKMAEKQRVFNELEIARNIQARFLPQINPSVSGLAIASICRPANEVGGDYYDFVHSEDKLHVIVGDVSGKGVSAAFYMTMTKGIVKTLAKSITKPSRMLSEINEVFYQNTPRNIFISLLYGVFDMKKRELRFARAGHNPLLVWKSTGEQTSLLSPGGLAIGMDNGKVFREVIQEEVVPFEPGDIFVFYTDGISESMNSQDEEYGEERLSEVLKSCREDSAEIVLQKINTAIDEFTGETPQHDDFTMVVIKVDDLS